MTIADPRKTQDLWLQPDDILIERSNTPELVGTARLYRGEPRFAIFPDLLIRVRVNKDVLPEFVEFSLQTNTARKYFMQCAQGSAGTMPKIDQGVIEEFPLVIPSLKEQQEIVVRVEALFKLADTIEKRVTTATLRAEKLTQAILAKAFRGELVPTEAELARRESRDYEPASALLARIRAERESSSGPSREPATSSFKKPMGRRARKIRSK
jgi:type I restriction enzyme S subunit